MIWIKDNGDEIELNDCAGTVEYAKSLNWKVKEKKVEKVEEKKEAPKKKAKG